MTNSNPPATKYRLITRSDFDGLVSAVLLKELDLIDEIKFVHPKDMQDGLVEVTDRDILTNLPYDRRCHLCFDHHASEAMRTGNMLPNQVLDPYAESAAAVVYRHYGGATRFPDIRTDMLEAVDKADSARFTMDDVLHAGGWELLSFVMDARTGLGRFKDFRISNYALMMNLIDCCQSLSIEEILALPDVKDRVDLYHEHREQAEEQIRRCATVHGPLVVLDLREEETIYVANRFLIYALFPECNISTHVIWGREKQNTVFAIGKSIFDRSSPVHVGALALEYEGGGHAAAGTCQVANDDADRVRGELISHIVTMSTAAA